MAPFFVVTRQRIALLLAIGSLLGLVAGGGAQVALSRAKLEEVATKTQELEAASTSRDLRLQEVSTKLEDVIAGINRIEDRLDGNAKR